MKKVWLSVLFIGVITFGVFTTFAPGSVSAQSQENVIQSEFPIQPPF